MKIPITVAVEASWDRFVVDAIPLFEFLMTQ